MIIPHIRTTFPASTMFQVDEGSENELALLFAEDLSINTTGAEEDSTAPPDYHNQLKEDEEPYIIPDLGVNEVIVEIEEKLEMSSLPILIEEEEEELTKSSPPTNDPKVTTTIKEEKEKTKTPPTSDLNNTTTTTAVITLFLPMGFSRVSAHKMRQPEQSRPDPTRARHIK